MSRIGLRADLDTFYRYPYVIPRSAAGWLLAEPHNRKDAPVKILVQDLLPNPFRDLTRYPINQEKIETLKTSIGLTTFWDNLLARPSPTNPKKKELAYGIHRLRALEQLSITAIDIPVRNLSDTDMMRIMAHENMTEWAHNAEIDQETVRAVVRAFADSRIELPTVNSRRGAGEGVTRYAPWFKVGKSILARAEKGYTVNTVASFLGWKRHKVEGALDALAIIEEDLASEDTFKGLTSRQAQEVAEQTRRIRRETSNPDLAKNVGKRLAAGMRQTISGIDRKGRERSIKDVTIHNARQKADEMAQAELPRRPRPELPEITGFARDLIDIFRSFLPELLPPGTPLPDSMRRLQRGQELNQKLEAIIQHREHLPDNEARDLRSSLRALANRLNAFADKLESLPTTRKRQQLPSPDARVGD